MLPSHEGSFRLFRLFGIQVFLHWSWFLVAVYEINGRAHSYSSMVWNVIEYLALFAIVLMHEFGHSLACRQTGGKADQIVLWPLGGVAYVSPPQRPGAVLWSIAAGPLVNLVLLPVFALLLLASQILSLPQSQPDVHHLLTALLYINGVLLVFNILPVYPLDGGQMLRALLWFRLGRMRSLKISCVIGFMGVIGLVGLAIYSGSVWTGIMAFFIASNCWRSWQHAKVLEQLESAPRHNDFS